MNYVEVDFQKLLLAMGKNFLIFVLAHGTIPKIGGVYYGLCPYA